MDNLLTLAFDNLSSRSPQKIHKGLRQIEGLLAQICLSRSSTSTSTPNKRHSALPTTSTTTTTTPLKTLITLSHDLAFLEFFRLQQSFEWNAATRLLETLNHVLSHPAGPQTDALTLSALNVLLGLLLLHPPSRSLFARATYMNILLDLLDPTATSAETLAATLLVLVAALLGTPGNARAFEAAGGLQTVTSLFKAQGRGVTVTQEVRLKVLEFLYFYLMPETSGSVAAPGSASAGVLGKTSSTVKSDGSGSSEGSNISQARTEAKTVEQKQALLGKYLGNVEDLVQDLRVNAPFGVASF